MTTATRRSVQHSGKTRSRARQESPRLRFDELENRTLLAGNCNATVTSTGQLVIRCDNQSNFVSVEGYDGYVEVEGHEGTTINGRGSVELRGFTSDLRIQTLGGDDYVYLYQLEVPGNLSFNGGRGTDYLGGRQDSTAVAGKTAVRVEQQGGVAQADVMEVKLNEAINQLSQRKLPEEVYRRSIDQVAEALFVSNLVVLPTPDPNPQDPDPEFERFQEDLNRAIEALSGHINEPLRNNGVGTEASKAEAADLRNFLQLTQEALQAIGAQTDFCDPENVGPVGGAGCQFLEADDEGGNIVDTVLGGLFARNVRSPFPFLLNSSSAPSEQVISTGGLEDGECAAIVKEIQGIKLVVTPRLLPIWVEPWFARARVVGFKTVWVAEFIPAEHLKTISVCNNAGSVTTTVDTQVVLERQLLHFWRFLDKD